MYQRFGAQKLTTPEKSIYIGAGTMSGSDPAGGEDAIVNEIVIGVDTVGNGANTITLGSGAMTEFHCQVALTVDSDKRIKKNITNLPTSIDIIDALNPVSFKKVNPADYPNEIKSPNYKDRTIKEKDRAGKEVSKLVKADPRPKDNNKVYVGLIAQDVEKVLKDKGLDWDIVKTGTYGKKSITYGELIPVLIKAVQELSQKVKALEER